MNEDLGYQLHQAVQKTKNQLSTHACARFRFSDGVIDIDAEAARSRFEEWIEPELSALAACVDGLLRDSGVPPSDVNVVFLTGGTSLVPAVRRIFESRFGADRIRTGNEFTSVVRGLALKAGEHSR